MPVELPLPTDLKQAKWKVKIQDKERLEPPHVSILRGTDRWRINLRTGEFMDRVPDSKDVPIQIIDLIAEDGTWEWLCEQWDAMYSENPVVADED